MSYRIPSVAVMAIVAATLVACGATAPAQVTKKPTPRPTPTPSVQPVPTGPFAVVVTNSNRQGVNYQVELIDASAHVVASTTAKLPTLKPNQSIATPLVSASRDRVYLLDGDNDIRALSPSGQSYVVKTIADGASKILTFAVSPDDLQIAVALISQASDDTKSTSVGYVEDLADSGGHNLLWNNIGADALRWPIGWHDGELIDDIDPFTCGAGPGYGYQATLACSYHVVDISTSARIATVCEAPASTPSGSSSYYTLWGIPTAAGTACLEDESVNGGCNTGSETWTITNVDWTGKEHDFITKTNTGCAGYGLSINGCYLSPDGALMACQDSVSNAVTMLKPDGSTHSLGRKYNIQGWIDATHLFVEVDANTLGVVDIDTGALTTLAADHADQIDMVTALPGGL